MNEALGLLLSLAAGGLLGGMYYGGLWWTVQKGLSSRHPAIWFSSSLLLRTATALAGIYWVGQDSWTRLLTCMIGFLAARVIVTWLTRLPEERVTAREGARYAPEPR